MFWTVDYIDCVFFFFFFFQAEDGIRDLTVTGVQTCALPISRLEPPSVKLPTATSLRRASPSPERTEGGSSLVWNLGTLEAGAFPRLVRSEERRVGEEGRSRWAPDH